MHPTIFNHQLFWLGLTQASGLCKGFETAACQIRTVDRLKKKYT